MSTPATAEEKTNKKNDVKARGLLLMALPNEYQLTFSQHPDAKSMFAAIETRFGGNAATKKTQKTLLKQQSDNAAILGVIIAQEDLNLKILSSLPPEWNTHIVKKTVGTSSGGQNLAFMTAPSSSNTNDANIAYPQVSAASPSVNAAKQIHDDDLEAIDLNASTFLQSGVLQLYRVGTLCSGVQSTKKHEANSEIKTTPGRKETMKTHFKEPEIKGYGPDIINAVRVKRVNAIKSSAYWVWRPTKSNGAALAFKRHNYINARGRSNGCSRHMTGNIAYLSNFKEFDGGYVAFRGGAYGGKITGKGTLKTDNLDFEDDETSEILKSFIKEIENLVDKKVKIIRSDNGTEFKNKVMDDFCREKELVPVTARYNVSKTSAGTSEENSQDCIVMPIWKDTSYFDSPTKDVDNGEPKTAETKSSLKLNAVGPSVSTASPNEEDRFEKEPEVDLGNITNSYIIPTTPNTRIHKDHPIDNVIGEVQSTIQTRRMSKPTSEQGFLSDVYEQKTHDTLNTCLYACFLSQIEPTSIAKALSDLSWVEAMQEELLQFKLQQVWILVDLPNGKKAIGTKWVFRNKKDERGIVIMNPKKGRSSTIMGQDRSDIIYQEQKGDILLVISMMSSMGELTFFLGLQVQQRKDGIFNISQRMEMADDVDVHLYRSMIGSLMYLNASRPDIMFAVCACARFQVTPKTKHVSNTWESQGPPPLICSGPRCQDTILGDVNAQTRFEITSIQSINPPLSRGYTLGSGEDNMKLIGIDKILYTTVI
ncbi:putative ribonuclease H-like domain-containing protein [Tanacetum coccineum]